MEDLDGRVIVVTGAEGNMGPHAADHLIEAGATVVGTYIDEEEKEWADDRISNADAIDYHKVDLTDPDDVTEFASTVREVHGPVSGLVNLVGGFGPSTLEDSTLEDFQGGLALHGTTVFLSMKAFLDQLTETGGSIVNFTSERAIEAPAGFFNYNVGKSVVKTMTETAAKELEEVQVNAIMPYYIATPEKREAGEGMNRSHWHLAEDVIELIEFLLCTQSVDGELINPRAREPGYEPN